MGLAYEGLRGPFYVDLFLTRAIVFVGLLLDKNTKNKTTVSAKPKDFRKRCRAVGRGTCRACTQCYNCS